MDLVLLHTYQQEILQNLTMCFNPYFNGSSTSTIYTEGATTIEQLSFNPYFNGSSTSTSERMVRKYVDDSFNPYFNGSSTSTFHLVLLEVLPLRCFNPYFNGSSTSTVHLMTHLIHHFLVSILILMDLVLLLR